MKTISTNELKKRINAGESPYMIDVREKDEYDHHNIGAHHIPIGEIQALQIEKITAEKTDEIIIMCQRGQRSTLACLVLEQLGYTNVTNMQGGISAW